MNGYRRSQTRSTHSAFFPFHRRQHRGSVRHLLQPSLYLTALVSGWYLADRIDQSQDFVRLAPVPLSVVCFQYRTPDVSVHGDQKYLDG